MVDSTLAIHIRDLEFRYDRAANAALSVSSFQIKTGESVFLHGPSGSGKTTLLGLVTGILTPQHGQIEILGEDVTKLSVHQKDLFRGTRMGYIFQMFNLIPYLSVEENVELACLLNPKRGNFSSAQERKSAVKELLSHLGLTGYENASVSKLSVGQQQRVAAARALLGEPKLIVADEPTSALDQDSRLNFIDLLFNETSRYGGAILFVSHDKTLMSKFDRSVALSDINAVSK